ncbi:MAG TPA: 50S ribosomal protein L24 [Candidatus Polarisedimenticolia bacterium]|nr:50S ribosomal protein L24 [Candidatus Polarisedimenticolia bacterium]
MARRIRRGDLVVVLAGSDRGRTGKVLRVDPEHAYVWVEGCRMQYKHVRRSQQNPKGGRLHREGPLHLSNVALWSEKAGAPQRFRIELRDGRRVRVGRKDGEALS